MKKGNQKKIWIQTNYDRFMGLFMAGCALFCLLMPYILNWKNDSLAYEILFYTCLLSIIAYGLSTSLAAIQYAIISDDAILIKGLFIKTIVISRESIKSMTKENLSPRGFVRPCPFDFIVIRTDETAKVISYRKHTEICCQIVASKKNMTVLQNYALKFKIPFKLSKH